MQDEEDKKNQMSNYHHQNQSVQKSDRRAPLGFRGSSVNASAGVHNTSINSSTAG